MFRSRASRNRWISAARITGSGSITSPWAAACPPSGLVVTTPSSPRHGRRCLQPGDGGHRRHHSVSLERHGPADGPHHRSGYGHHHGRAAIGRTSTVTVNVSDSTVTAPTLTGSNSYGLVVAPSPNPVIVSLAPNTAPRRFRRHRYDHYRPRLHFKVGGDVDPGRRPADESHDGVPDQPLAAGDDPCRASWRPRARRTSW